MRESPFVSVVVPTSNRAELLTRCVESLRRQDYPAGSFELIVVDNGSTDHTPLLLHALGELPRLPEIRSLRLARRDANSARNAGVDAARGDPICIVDDDVLAPPGWLAALVAGALRHPDAGCLGGPIRILTGNRSSRCAQHPTAGMTFDEGAHEKVVGEIWGGNMAVRRSALAAVGPFREGLPRQQEWEWEQRLLECGGHMVYVPDAWLWHVGARSRTLTEAFMRGYMIGGRRTSTPPARAARYVAGAVAHAARARCRQGLVEGARHTGLLLGIVAARLRERRKPSRPG